MVTPKIKRKIYANQINEMQEAYHVTWEYCEHPSSNRCKYGKGNLILR